MINKSEQEIMQNWTSNEMMVSITCVAFNHEDFMEITLDSFLMQETSFPFEILINDDVSTDSTVQILKQYENKFPNIVKPVYQFENQYSRGINTMSILFPYINGKYVAFCDGDDYWVDNQKLRIQVEAMEKHPEVDLSFHPSYENVDGDTSKIRSQHANKDRVFPIEKVIKEHGDFAETASLMFTHSLIASLPSWFKTASPGDYVSQVMGSVRGGSLYINRIMCAYRTGLQGSWTEGEMRKSTGERRGSLKNITDQLTFLDNYLDNKYHQEFNSVITSDRFNFISMVSNEMKIKKEMYAEYKNDFSNIEKLKWHLLFKHQTLINSLKFIKLKLLSSQ